MKREDEETCKNAFNKYLIPIFGTDAVSWKDVDQKDEPPDYYLNLHGRTFAVEVTQIMVTRELDAEKISFLSAVRFLEILIKDVKQDANSFLNGSYFVSCPDILINYEYIRSSRNTLKEHMIDYIKDTQNLVNTPEKIILQKGYNKLFAILK